MTKKISWLRRLAAALAHGSWLFGIGIIVPLVLWLLFRKDAFVRPHAKQALALQVLMLIAICAAIIAMVELVGEETAVYGAVVLFVVSVFLPIFGIVKASRQSSSPIR